MWSLLQRKRNKKEYLLYLKIHILSFFFLSRSQRLFKYLTKITRISLLNQVFIPGKNLLCFCLFVQHGGTLSSALLANHCLMWFLFKRTLNPKPYNTRTMKLSPQSPDLLQKPPGLEQMLLMTADQGITIAGDVINYFSCFHFKIRSCFF